MGRDLAMNDEKRSVGFSSLEQFGLDLGIKPQGTSSGIDPDEVRTEMKLMLASARNATAEAPWDERTFRYNKLVFPQMARWLPDDEAAQLCFEFRIEVERIEPLLAA